MNKKNLRFIRWVILAVILVYITFAAYLHQTAEGTYPSIHALCPYGGLESLYALLFSGSFIKKIFTGTMVLLVLSVLITFLFRRSFCGLICPFGSLQEFFALLGQKIFGRRFNMPEIIDKPLRNLKYLILLLTLGFAWYTGSLWMSPYDPYSAYGHLSAGLETLMEESLIGFILLIVTIVGSLLYDRFFCKYLCPAGAFYGLLAKLSPYKIIRNDEQCIHCQICNKACPMNIKVDQEIVITSSECINCNECLNVCPKKDVLTPKLNKKSLSTAVVLLLSLGIFFGGISLAKASGIYTVTPAPVTSGSIQSVEQIKGSMTLEEVAKGLNINIDELYEKVGIPKTVPANTKLKDLSQYVDGVTPETVREKLENK
ncbi:4Fe-4S binding protein [Carboxydothermus islandicus]|nr:4Fe-4S binding protein [Carboxydothermus islandicus]